MPLLPPLWSPKPYGPSPSWTPNRYETTPLRHHDDTIGRAACTVRVSSSLAATDVANILNFHAHLPSVSTPSHHEPVTASHRFVARLNFVSSQNHATTPSLVPGL
jgi:hypothetical protein